MASNYKTIHLNVPLEVHAKLIKQAKKEFLKFSKLALVLIEKGLEDK